MVLFNHFYRFSENTPPTLTITNGSSVALQVGRPAHLVIQTSDAEGDPINVFPVEGFNTDCIITPIMGDVVNINTSRLMNCRIR